MEKLFNNLFKDFEKMLAESLESHLKTLKTSKGAYPYSG
jgi:hypothetical protein